MSLEAVTTDGTRTRMTYIESVAFYLLIPSKLTQRSAIV